MTDSKIDIVAIRDALDMTQTDIAKMFGVDKSTVSRWENGGVVPLLARREYERLEKSPSVAGCQNENNDRPAPIEPIGETRSAHPQATAPAVNSREVKSS